MDAKLSPSDAPFPVIATLFGLTFVTGLIDAVSFLGLGHVFTANMTGNVVFVGFALGGAADLSVLRSLAALGAFTITNCEFTNNDARGDQLAHDGFLGGPAAGVNFALGGGARVAYMNGYLNVVDSWFRDNIAENGDGGAILNGRAEAQDLLSTGADVFDVRTTVVNSTFIGNEAPAGNGGAIASLPGLVLSIPTRTVANTTLSATSSHFKGNSAGGNGGAIYLDASTATITSNAYKANRAFLGRSIYGVDSLINGSSTSPFIK
jgi:predicted outer membrane repeat protein